MICMYSLDMPRHISMPWYIKLDNSSLIFAADTHPNDRLIFMGKFTQDIIDERPYWS